MLRTDAPAGASVACSPLDRLPFVWGAPISARTVESHLRRLFERHNVASRTELASRAIREGWLEELS
jgi:hypothetical protein